MAKRTKTSRRTPSRSSNTKRGTPRTRAAVSPAWLMAPVLATALAIVYGPSIDVPFIFDDFHAIVSNESIANLWPLVGDAVRRGPLNPPIHTPTAARPLVNLSFALNYAVGGAEPTGYHLVNVILHYLSALLLWGIVRRTLRLPYFAGRFDAVGDWFAAAVAFIWALHPLQTEAVIYATQRTELMMALFYLATLYCSLRYFTATSTNSRTLWLGLAVVACAAGMLSKEVMVSAPLVVLLFERTFLASSMREILAKSWKLYAALACTWLPILLYHMNSPHSDAAGFHLGVPAYDWWFTQAKVLLMYFRLAVWPSPLLIHYQMPYLETIAEAWPYLLVVGVIGLASLVLLWRNHPVGFLGTAVFAVLAPTLVVPITTEMAAERRMYLPLAALTALAVVGGYAFSHSLRRRYSDAQRSFDSRVPLTAFGMVLLVIALAFSFMSARRLVAYEKPIDLWLEAVRFQPQSDIAHQNVGAELFKAGRLDEAIPWYRKAIEINPEATQAHYNFGLVLLQTNHIEEAIAEFREAVRQRPDLAEFHNNLGVALFSAGRPEEAIPLFRKTLELKPQMWRAHDNWGEALKRTGQLEEAIVQYKLALQINPTSLGVYKHLVEAYADTNQPAKAIDAAERALEIARSAGKADTARKIAAQLALYRARLADGGDLPQNGTARSPVTNGR